MGQRWKDCSLGDVITLQRGYDLPRQNRRDGMVPIVSSSGISGFHDSAKVSGPGVVTGRYGTLGEVFYVTENFWPLNTALFVKDFKGNNPRFVSYFLRTLNFGKQDVAGAVPGVNRNILHMMPVRVPCVPIQGKIAAILSAYDDLIENNTRRIAILEALAQVLYREWFVYFRFPGHEHVAMVESSLGQIPAGWDIKKIGDVVDIYRGRSYRGVDLVEEGGLPFLNLKCIERGGGFRIDGVKRYNGIYKETQTARAGDIIVGVTDMTQERRLVAHAARVPRMDWDFAVSSMDLVKVAPHPEIPASYLYGLLRFSSFSDEVKQHANGANVLHLNPERIEAFPFPLAPEDLRCRFAEICSPLYDQRDVLALKNTNLRATRDLLLPKLISGALDVADLDIDTGALLP